MKLSIVSTMYRSAPYLREFHRRCVAAAEMQCDDFEIVLVNDGSPDESLQVALELRRADPRVVVVDLSRNFGHHKAMMTGLAQARGERVFLLDSDLEEPPEALERFWAMLDAGDCDVAYGVQESRKGGPVERIAGRLFYAMFDRLTRVRIPRDVVTARLMSRRYVDALILHRDREVFLAGLWALTGFEQKPLALRKLDKGSTTYTVRRRVEVLVNAVTSFSSRPLHYIFYFGLAISAVAAAFIGWLVYQKLFHARALDGWTSLIVSVWFMGGLNASFLGLIGIYVAKVFTETKDRPYTVIRAIHGGTDERH
jgi:putative glycosyltransferase